MAGSIYGLVNNTLQKLRGAGTSEYTDLPLDVVGFSNNAIDHDFYYVNTSQIIGFDNPIDLDSITGVPIDIGSVVATNGTKVVCVIDNLNRLTFYNSDGIIRPIKGDAFIALPLGHISITGLDWLSNGELWIADFGRENHNRVLFECR